MLVADMDNPKHIVFKIALWGSEAEDVLNNQMSNPEEWEDQDYYCCTDRF